MASLLMGVPIGAVPLAQEGTAAGGESDLTTDAGEIAARTEARLTALQARDKQIADLVQMVDQLLALLGETQTSNLTRRETIGALAQQLNDATSARDEVERELEVLNTERDRLTLQVAELAAAREENAEVQTTFETLVLEIETLLLGTVRLETALAGARANVELRAAQISQLETQLAEALASEAATLSRYRSEFFGRLGEVLGEQPDIRVVGDRFVFQSEVLFDSGSAALGADGQVQLAKLADTLLRIAPTIPSNIPWILRIDGHTDQRLIATSAFPSNWALSTARALAVVEFLIDRGVGPEQLVAAGFGQYHPIDPHDDEIALRRNRRIEIKLTQR